MAEVPAQYGPGVRRGALFTIWFTAPWSLAIFPAAIAVQAVTGAAPYHKLDAVGLAQAGRFPALVALEHLVDGSEHIAFFIAFLTLAVVIAVRWPVRAVLLFSAALASLLFGWAKTLTAIYTAVSLGSQYLVADGAGQTALVAAGRAYDGVYTGLEWMDTYPLVLAWILVALLPAASGVSRWVRSLGWVLAIGIGAPWNALLPTNVPIVFLATALLLPVYFFLLGRWLLRLPRPSSAV